MSDEKEKTSHKKKIIIIAALGVLAAVIGISYYIRSLTVVSTDDAYVAGHSVSVSPKISGNIIKLYFDDNQKVEKGQLLLEIDPVDYQVKYEQAVSSVEGAKSQKEAAERQIAQSEANLKQIYADTNSVKAEYSLAEADYKRYTRLYKTGAASKQDFDRSETAYKSVKSKLDSITQKAAAAQEQISVSKSQSKTASAQIKQFLANAKQAKLNLSYTKIYAPESGCITSKSVEEGVYVQTGQPLFAIVPENRWIVANFKETEIANIHPGQPVSIKVDTYPFKEFKGKVDSIQRSTGSATSMFPPENAVGSFVKVVQRVPVKILFTEKIGSQYNIVPGMSVIPEVKIKK